MALFENIVPISSFEELIGRLVRKLSEKPTMSTSDLFLKAFSGKSESEAGRGRHTSPDERTDLFQQAFATDKADLPTPHKGQNWRVDNKKARKLSFAELYQLQELQGVEYRSLPDWVIDEGLAIPSKEEAKYQREMEANTGLNQSERNRVFSAFNANIEALADMAGNDILRDSAVLEGELKEAVARYGTAEVMDGLKEVNPEAAEYFTAKLQVLQAQEKAQAMQQQEAASEESIKQELMEAKEAIEAMNSASALTDEQIQQELTRRAAEKTRAMGEE